MIYFLIMWSYLNQIIQQSFWPPSLMTVWMETARWAAINIVEQHVVIVSPPAEMGLHLFRQLDVWRLRKDTSKYVSMPIKDAWISGRGRCAWSCLCHLVFYLVAVSGWGKCMQLQRSSSSCAWLLPPMQIIIIILVVRVHPFTLSLFFSKCWGVN